MALGINCLGLDNGGASHLHNTPFQPYPPNPLVDTVALELFSYTSAIGNPTPLHGDGSGNGAYAPFAQSGGDLPSFDASISGVKSPKEQPCQRPTTLESEETACSPTLDVQQHSSPEALVRRGSVNSFNGVLTNFAHPSDVPGVEEKGR